MHPYLFVIPLGQGIEVKAYSFFLILSGLIFILVSLMLLTRGAGVSLTRSAAMLLGIAAAVPVGARLLHIVTNGGYYAANPAAMLQLQPAGLALYGGLIMGAATAGLFCWKMRLEGWKIADALVPGLGLSIATARVGCFLNGCCFGRPTRLPWGVVFPAGSPASMYQGLAGKGPLGLMSLLAPVSSKPVHPTQIYELIAALLGTILALYLIKRKARPGIAFLTFVVWFTIFRWFNWTLRVPPASMAVPPWFYPVLYAVLLVFTVFLLIWRMLHTSALTTERRAYPDGEQEIRW